MARSSPDTSRPNTNPANTNQADTNPPNTSRRNARGQERARARHIALVRFTLLGLAFALISQFGLTSATAAIPRVRPVGLGTAWSHSLVGHQQVIVVSAANRTATRVTVTAWDRVGNRWYQVGNWSGHAGAKGWYKAKQRDQRSPVGMFTLSSAGGYLKNPGTVLPYQYNRSRYSTVKNHVRTFDYVLAIDFNHKVGTPPLSNVYPQGYAKGGHIWVHVDHNSPTNGCITMPESGLLTVLRWLDPAKKPVIVMGPANYLAGAGA